MSRLHGYHILCPLIDQNSFLGISSDKQNDCVVATLGRNVVMKFRLSDQKQIGGWTSKDHLTTAVIYDRNDDVYAAVVNRRYLKIWNDSCNSLDKVKKIKFSLPITKIETRMDGAALIIFSNGHSSSLSHASEYKKLSLKTQFLKDNEIIVDMSANKIDDADYMCYFIRKENEFHLLKCPLNYEIGTIIFERVQKIPITCGDSNLLVVGKLLSSQIPLVYILWSDSKLYSLDLRNNLLKPVGAVPMISCKNRVSLQWMGDDHIALFGSDKNNDGAIIIVYNINMGIVSCSYPLKMYCEGAKIYSINEKLILEAGNHLAMIPYSLHMTKTLASYVGSHKNDEHEEIKITDWNFGTSNIKDKCVNAVSEREMCLKFIQGLRDVNNYAMISKNIKKYTDIPESIIVELLKYVIQSIKTDITICNDIPDDLFNDQVLQSDIINILKFSINETVIIPHIIDKLDQNILLLLLLCICNLLKCSSSKVNNIKERSLLDWLALLIDCSYKQFLTTKNEFVSKVLAHVLETITEMLDNLNMVDEIISKLSLIIQKTDSEDGIEYSIELINLT